MILSFLRVEQLNNISGSRKCRNWQTSKTKDLVIIAIVWVQVPSSADEKDIQRMSFFVAFAPQLIPFSPRRSNLTNWIVWFSNLISFYASSALCKPKPTFLGLRVNQSASIALLLRPRFLDLAKNSPIYYQNFRHLFSF